MGNICSSDKNAAEPFSQPGRVLGSANRPPNAAPRAPLPAKSKAQAPFKSPGRTLGETASAPEGTDAERADARTNAAIAAQVSPPNGVIAEGVACHKVPG
jgi:hypothetical protein